MCSDALTLKEMYLYYFDTIFGGEDSVGENWKKTMFLIVLQVKFSNKASLIDIY